MWLKEGDKNFKFFHAKASYRRRHNGITFLQNDDGIWLEDAQLDDHIGNYFNSLFLASEERDGILRDHRKEIPLVDGGRLIPRLHIGGD